MLNQPLPKTPSKRKHHRHRRQNNSSRDLKCVPISLTSKGKIYFRTDVTFQVLSLYIYPAFAIRRFKKRKRKKSHVRCRKSMILCSVWETLPDRLLAIFSVGERTRDLGHECQSLIEHPAPPAATSVPASRRLPCGNHT